MNARHITSAVNLLDSKGGKRIACVVRCYTGCRMKYCMGASPVRHICSLQNNLLP